MKDRFKIQGTRKYFYNNLSEFPGYWEGGGIKNEARYIYYGPLTHILYFRGNNEFRMEGIWVTGVNQYETEFQKGSPGDLLALINKHLTKYKDKEDSFSDALARDIEDFN